MIMQPPSFFLFLTADTSINRLAVALPRADVTSQRRQTQLSPRKVHIPAVSGQCHGTGAGDGGVVVQRFYQEQVISFRRRAFWHGKRRSIICEDRITVVYGSLLKRYSYECWQSCLLRSRGCISFGCLSIIPFNYLTYSSSFQEFLSIFLHTLLACR